MKMINRILGALLMLSIMGTAPVGKAAATIKVPTAGASIGAKVNFLMSLGTKGTAAAFVADDHTVTLPPATADIKDGTSMVTYHCDDGSEYVVVVGKAEDQVPKNCHRGVAFLWSSNGGFTLDFGAAAAAAGSGSAGFWSSLGPDLHLGYNYAFLNKLDCPTASSGAQCNTDKSINSFVAGFGIRPWKALHLDFDYVTGGTYRATQIQAGSTPPQISYDQKISNRFDFRIGPYFTAGKFDFWAFAGLSHLTGTTPAIQITCNPTCSTQMVNQSYATTRGLIGAGIQMNFAARCYFFFNFGAVDLHDFGPVDSNEWSGMAGIGLNF